MSKLKQADSKYVLDAEERYFLNPESVSRHLFCSICQEVFSLPHRAPCGHSFCRQCIFAWLKQKQTCPEDRKPVRVTDLHHDFILENIIGDQMVACPFRKFGCDFIGQLQVLSGHRASCIFNPTNLPEFLKTSVTSPCSIGSNIEASSDDVLPELTEPSLKMRLFKAGGQQRDMLCSMFEHTDGDKAT